VNEMEKDKLRKVIVGVISVIVTISVIAYFSTLLKPEKPYWYYFGPLLLLYWVIFITLYSKRKKKKGGD